MQCQLWSTQKAFRRIDQCLFRYRFNLMHLNSTMHALSTVANASPNPWQGSFFNLQNPNATILTSPTAISSTDSFFPSNRLNAEPLSRTTLPAAPCPSPALGRLYARHTPAVGYSRSSSQTLSSAGCQEPSVSGCAVPGSRFSNIDVSYHRITTKPHLPAAWVKVSACCCGNMINGSLGPYQIQKMFA